MKIMLVDMMMMMMLVDMMTVMNSVLLRWSPRVLLGRAFSQSPAPSLDRHLSLANSLGTVVAWSRRLWDSSSTRADSFRWVMTVTSP